MSPDEDAAPVLWAEAQRQLAEQTAAMDRIRTRCVALLSVVTLVAGFLIGQHVGHASITREWARGCALGLFVSTALAALYLQMPRTWSYAPGLSSYIGDLEETGVVNPAVFYSNATRDLFTCIQRNNPRLGAAHRVFVCVCALVGLQVLAWGLAAFA